jgi:hypothetical protein
LKDKRESDEKVLRGNICSLSSLGKQLLHVMAFNTSLKAKSLIERRLGEWKGRVIGPSQRKRMTLTPIQNDCCERTVGVQVQAAGRARLSDGYVGVLHDLARERDRASKTGNALPA